MIPRTGEAAPTLDVDPNIFRSTGAPAEATCGPIRGSGAAASSCRWFWLVGAVVLSLLPPLVKNAARRHRGGRHRSARLLLVGIAVGSGLASWLAERAHRAAADAVAALLMGVFGLDLAFAVYRAPAADRRPPAPGLPAERHGAARRASTSRPRRRRRPVHRPGLRRRAGLGRRRRRARVIAAVNVLSAAFMVAGAIVVALACRPPACRLRDAPGGPRRRQHRGRRRHLPHPADERLPRPALDPVPRLLPAGGRRASRTSTKAGPNAIIALQPCRASSTARSPLSLLDRDPVFAIDHGIAQALVGEAVPEARPARCRSTRPSRMATRTLINAVQGRRDAGHLPRRPAHRHRQPDEGL